jgi:hypothetical protein
MRTFAQKPKATQQTTSPKSALPSRAHFGLGREVRSILHSQRTIGNQAVRRLLEANTRDVQGNAMTGIGVFGHSFSRIPVFPRQVIENQQTLRASGEMAGGSLNEGEEWLPATGNGGAQTAASATGGITPPRAAGSTPLLKKTTVSPLSTQNNGAFRWGVRWSIANATGSTKGWIVQHVVVRQNVKAWHPPLLPGATRPIVPGQRPWGGLSTSWYPLWEAWQVRGGAVFVGGSTSAHNADTYGQPAVGANTKGRTEVVGRANFYPNLTLPAAFTVRNAAPAWALPATHTAPGLTGGTGALDHNLTAAWDDVGGTGATTATTV